MKNFDLIFELQRHELVAGDERREALVLEAPDWINVIPILDDGRVVLIRQWRFGIRSRRGTKYSASRARRFGWRARRSTRFRI